MLTAGICVVPRPIATFPCGLDPAGTAVATVFCYVGRNSKVVKVVVPRISFILIPPVARQHGKVTHLSMRGGGCTDICNFPLELRSMHSPLSRNMKPVKQTE